ncbi:MAG: HD domain-containing protein [Thermoanaerobaculia bacterium]
MATELPAADGISRIVGFALELDRLKAVERRTKPLGLDRYENSAEHSWQISILAILLARYSREAVDLQRVLEMLLVHDIPEIDCGDQFVYARDAAAVAVAEARAAKRIFGLLPPGDGGSLLSRWQEFEDRTSPEARLAHAADRLMPVLQNLYGGGQSWRENAVPVERVRDLVREALADTCPEVWDFVAPLIEAFFAQGSFPE